MSDAKQSNSFLSPLPVMTAAVLAAGVAVQSPALKSARPPDAERRAMSITGAQDVDARLWQDPFSVVDANLVRNLSNRSDPKAGAHLSRSDLAAEQMRKSDPRHAFSVLGEKVKVLSRAGATTGVPAVMPVLITGAGNPEDIEYRRRTRYAIVSALMESGYAPSDEAHLGYVWSWNPVVESARTERLRYVIPYEWFECDHKTRCTAGHKVLVMWLEEEAFAEGPGTQLVGFARALGVERLSIIGPSSTATFKALLQGSHCEVPPGGAGPHFVCTLERNGNTERPTTLRFFSPWTTTPWPLLEPGSVLDAKADRIEIYRAIGTDDKVATAIVDELRLRGSMPSTRGLIEAAAQDREDAGRRQAMHPWMGALDEAVSPAIRWWRSTKIRLQRLRCILKDELGTSPFASWWMLDRYLAWEQDRLGERCKADALERRMRNDPAKFAKSASPDSRHEQPAAPTDLQRSSRRHSAYLLVYERDTRYSRELMDRLKASIEARCGNCTVYTAGYFRGLDGIGPDRVREGDENVRADSSRREGAVLDLPGAVTKHERSFGRTQFDYLRRAPNLADPPVDLAGMPDNIDVRAIGVLGNDVYDKLVILQSLRDRFQRATFFTTDLDARMFQSDQSQWTRNLVVVSSFGLALNPALQGSTPPFRDSYQTATFFGALLAMQAVRSPEPLQAAKIDRWMRDPNGIESDARTTASPAPHAAGKTFNGFRIFEIGRTRAIELDANGASKPCASLTDCPNIHPLREQNYLQLPSGLGDWKKVFAIAGFFLLLLFVTWRGPWILLKRIVLLPVLLSTIAFELLMRSLRWLQNRASPARQAAIHAWRERRLSANARSLFTLEGTRFWRDYGRRALMCVWWSIVGTMYWVLESLHSLLSRRMTLVAKPARGFSAIHTTWRIERGNLPAVSRSSITEDRLPDCLRQLRQTVLIVPCLLATSVVLLIGWAVGRRIATEGQQGIGEPFLLTEGVSVWPPQLLRVLSIMLCAYFIARSWQAVRDLIGSIDKADAAFELGRTEPARRLPARARLKRWIVESACIAWRWLMLTMLGPFAGFGGRRSPVSNRIRDRFTRGDQHTHVDAPALWKEYCKRMRWHYRTVWTVLVTTLLFAVPIAINAMSPDWNPVLPARGNVARIVDGLLFHLHMFVSIYLVVTVVYIIGTTNGFIERLSRQSSRWPDLVLQRVADNDQMSRDLAGDWVDFRIITKMTVAVNPLIYWPFVTLVLIYLIRSPVFDATNFPISLQVLAVTCLGYATYSAYTLRRSAEAARVNALEDFDRALMRMRSRPSGAGNGDQENLAKQIEQLIERIKNERSGAFSPLAQQPFVRALMIPIGSFGTVSVAEYLTFLNM